MDDVKKNYHFGDGIHYIDIIVEVQDIFAFRTENFTEFSVELQHNLTYLKLIETHLKLCYFRQFICLRLHVKHQT